MVCNQYFFYGNRAAQQYVSMFLDIARNLKDATSNVKLRHAYAEEDT